jgi:hypothetical protein
MDAIEALSPQDVFDLQASFMYLGEGLLPSV